jgi:ferric-dicitrate binding protein FerR (iron transport regulator)
MNDKIPYEIIAKYLSGECSAKEKERLEEWKKQQPQNKKVFDELSGGWNKTSPPDYQVNVEEALEKVSAKLGAQQTKKLPVRKLSISVAAIFILAFGLFALIETRSPKSNGIVISTLADATPTEYTLPDGSVVTMNKSSILCYPKKFRNNERRIAFYGEGYFDIVSDKSKPFIIESGKTETRVVGTEFNLKTKPDSTVRVIVTEGLVALRLTESLQEELLLEIGQAGEYSSKENRLIKEENQDKNFLSWKSGRLSFVDMELSKAIHDISRHYNVEIKLGSTEMDSLKFTATFEQLSLEETMENLALIIDAKIVRNESGYSIRLN